MNMRNQPKSHVINTRNTKAIPPDVGFRYIRSRSLRDLAVQFQVGDVVLVRTNRTNNIGTSMLGRVGVIKEIKQDRWIKFYAVKIDGKLFDFYGLEISPHGN